MTRSATIDTAQLNAAAVALVMAALPHAGHLPFWVLALVPGAIALRLALGRPPGRWLLIGLVTVVFAAVLLRFRTIAGPTAGGAFFCAMVALKFLESRDRRDLGIVLCLAYFLAIAVFLHTEAIFTATLVLLAVLATTVALTFVAEPDGPSTRTRLRLSGTLLLQAIPVMVVLFLLFPRLPGPIWGLGNEKTARTGLDDRMAPGDITRLTESSEVAFRVDFRDEPPAASERYWRGPVFWSYDGRTWTRGESRHSGLEKPVDTGRERDYTLILEPHGRKWLFGLDVPVSVDGDVRRSTGYEFVTEERIDSVRRYEMRSALDYRLEPELPRARRERALRLPEGSAPRARELAERWRDEADSRQGIVDRALAFLREEDFVYTLSPDPLGDTPVDTLLFETRTGFCEHFASAFTVLMRAAGIPARVVTGYQGGEINDDYMIVRQSDAHAWTEVWLPERGWTRVDPTGAVSTTRLDAGIGSLEDAGELNLMSRRDSGVLREAVLLWDSVNHGWNRFVLGYGPTLQQQLFERLGMDALGRWALALVMLAAVGLMMAAVWLLALRPIRPRDPVERLWRRARRRVGRIGIEPHPAEGPIDLAARVWRTRPDAGPAFTRIASAYVRQRFRPHADDAGLRELRAAVRAFRPRRRAPASQSTGAGTGEPAGKR
ncbi:MAG: transglutaminase TgpA family protein [Halofilum sp. (in: g-proteobacteria)]